MPSHRSSVQVIKQQVVGTKIQPTEMDFLAIEDPLEIVIRFSSASASANPISIVTMRTPGKDSELIHGFLFSEGIIQKASDILHINFNNTSGYKPPTRAQVQLSPGLTANAAKTYDRGFTMHSACGVCGTNSITKLALPPALRIEDNTQVDANWIHSMPSRMNKEQQTFHQTGGLHAAAIFSSSGELLSSHEDIGRHNALDKAIGANLISGHTPAYGQTLCVSGRMSYEILQKAIIARIPIIAGVGAPSSLAVTLANDFNVTLVGFVRNNRYNIYSCPERLFIPTTNGSSHH